MRVIVGAFALWLATLIVGGSGDHGFWVEPMSAEPYAHILTLLLVAFVFGVVNATLGRVVRFVSIPLYIITLGLFSLIANGIMISVVAWLSESVGFGLRVDSFWWGVLGALVMSVIASVLNAVFGTGKKKSRDR